MCIRDRGKADYDGGPIGSYPERQGWKIQILTTAKELQVFRHGQAVDMEDFSALLQTWLYFGLIHEMFGEHCKAADFVHVAEPEDATSQQRTLGQCLRVGLL